MPWTMTNFRLLWLPTSGKQSYWAGSKGQCLDREQRPTSWVNTTEAGGQEECNSVCSWHKAQVIKRQMAVAGPDWHFLALCTSTASSGHHQWLRKHMWTDRRNSGERSRGAWWLLKMTFKGTEKKERVTRNEKSTKAKCWRTQWLKEGRWPLSHRSASFFPSFVPIPQRRGSIH